MDKVLGYFLLRVFFLQKLATSTRQEPSTNIVVGSDAVFTMTFVIRLAAASAALWPKPNIATVATRIVRILLNMFFLYLVLSDIFKTNREYEKLS
jgi:hypothetical protein